MLPTLQNYQKRQVTAVQLGGLNLTENNADGDNGSKYCDWSWTQNTDTAMVPIIRRREKRIHIGQLAKPNGICALDRLCFVYGEKFFWNGYYYGDVEDSEKMLVPMGSDICIFPDKRIFNTASLTFRDMEHTNSIDSGTVSIKLAQADGSEWLPEPTASATAPANPQNGDHWLDMSEDPIVMKTWSEAAGMWVDEYTTCVAVEADGIGAGLAVDDAVTVEGLTVASLNGTWQLLAVDDDRIVYTGVISEEEEQDATEDPVTVKRETPDMDYVIEHNNRLWGCSSENHEIYASALGDPTNWRRYAGISTDSWAVTVGTPGPFTGMAVVNSTVCAMKEDCIHKVYGTMPANFQTTVDHYRGVENGSAKSIVKINEMLYYKSVFDVCAYNGTEVMSISKPLGTTVWKNAVAGVNDRRLYISMQDEDGTWHLLTYDTTTGLWMREDGVQAVGFASCLTETFMMAANGGLWALRSAEYAKNNFLENDDYTIIGPGGETFEAVEETDAECPWILRTGEIMARLPNNQRIGKIELLVDLPAGTTMTVKVKKDNEPMETVYSVESGDERRYPLPIYPRRCDRLMIELSGTGPMKLYNMSWLIEGGSEYGRA